MGSYELDKENYLHYSGDGWITTKRPLTKEQITQFKDNTLNLLNLDWDN